MALSTTTELTNIFNDIMGSVIYIYIIYIIYIYIYMLMVYYRFLNAGRLLLRRRDINLSDRKGSSKII